MLALFGTLTLLGVVIIAAGAMGSDIGIDLGMGGAEPLSSTVVGLFLGIGGAVGLITTNSGYGQTTTCIIAAAFGFIAAIIGAIAMRWLISRSSDGNEMSAQSLVGRKTTSIDDREIKSGELGKIRIELGDPPLKTAMFFKSDEDVPANAEVIINRIENNGSVAIVTPTGGGEDEAEQ